MQFSVQGRHVCLQGLYLDQLRVNSELKSLKPSFINQHGWLLQMVALTQQQEETLIPVEVQKLLDCYNAFFEEPVGLPSVRAFDHKIVLKEGTPPISVRLYRYPHYQKTEIEKIVTNLLKTGVVRPSQSPFSSLVLLVKEADGSWRMCVDYRALN